MNSIPAQHEAMRIISDKDFKIARPFQEMYTEKYRHTATTVHILRGCSYSCPIVIRKIILEADPRSDVRN